MTGDPVAGGDSGLIESEPATAGRVFGLRLDQARGYVQSLATDGIVRGLIGPRESGKLWTRHVLNSAAAAALLTEGSRIVDIGSGAGLPGIPLALARSDCRFDLVEPLERRADYLREIVSELGLLNVRVIRGRAEDVVADCGSADVVTSRAVAPLAKLAGWSVPLLRLGGEMLALKGSRALEEVDRDRAALVRLGLRDPEVIVVGEGVVDPPTFVVRATFAGRPVGGRQRRRSKSTGQRNSQP